MGSKLEVAKVELQKLTARWRKEWRDAIEKWSEKIYIADDLHKRGKVLRLPTDNGNNYHFFESWSDFSSGGEQSLSAALDYQSRSAHQFLSAVPINLFALVYRHFVVAFGGNFSVTSLHFEYTTNKNLHYFLTDDDYKRNRQVIRKSAPHLFPTTDKTDNSEFDGWEAVNI